MLSPNVMTLLGKYMSRDIYKLEPDINENKLKWNCLSGNERAINMLKNNYKVYLVDEFRTSCMCSICKEETGRCEKFQIRENPKPYKSGNILVHGAIRCKNCEAVWNRDVNGATNIYRIAKNAINGIERPKYLCREKKDENIKVEKPKKEKVKKVVQKKAKISVKVVALTKS